MISEDSRPQGLPPAHLGFETTPRHSELPSAPSVPVQSNVRLSFASLSEAYLASAETEVCEATDRPPDRPSHSHQMKFRIQINTPRGLLISASALPDSGCTGTIVSASFARRHALETAVVQKPASLRLADGKMIGTMTHMAKLPTAIGGHHSEDWHWITDIIGYDVIFGQPWLERHDPTIRWSERAISLDSDYCRRNCLREAQIGRAHV